MSVHPAPTSAVSKTSRRPADAALSWKIQVDAPALVNSPWPARVSVPLPPGQAPPSFNVSGPDGTERAAQWRTLTQWPDGSVRWVQLDFQSTAAGLHVARVAPPGGVAVVKPVEIVRDKGRFQITVGRMQLTVDPPSGKPISRIAWQGLALSSESEPWSFQVTTPDGTIYPLSSEAARKVDVTAEGPNRFTVSWESHHADSDGRHSLDVRFRLEVLAGVEGFSLSYQFFHKLPRQAVLEIQSIEAKLTLDALTKASDHVAVVQQSYGPPGLRRFVRTRRPQRILVDRTRYGPYVDDPGGDLDDQYEYPPFLLKTNQDVGGVVALEGQDVAVVCALRDLECQRPKVIRAEPGSVVWEIWPRRAGVLRLPQGRSNRQVFHVQFAEADEDAVNAFLARPLSCQVEPAVGWLDKSDSLAAGATWDQPRLLDNHAPDAKFFSWLLRSGTARWHTVAEMFHYGDTPDAGYTTSYAPTGRSPAQADGSPREMLFTPGRVAHPAFHPRQSLPPVWTNNEYDAIYCVALEAIRTRDRNVLETLRAAARHQLEVDFIHYSDHLQQHRSTPAHSYDHTSGTASIPSHQWTQGLYYYYCLSGDEDVPEVVRAICDYNIMHLSREDLQAVMGFDREIGWALVALVFGYEMTAEERYLDAARRLIARLRGFEDQTDFRQMSVVSATLGNGQNLSQIGAQFNVNTLPLGLKCFHQASGEPWALELLQAWVELGMRNHNNRGTGVKISELFYETLCYICEITGNTQYLRDSLWQLMIFLRGPNSLGWMDDSCVLDTKRYARVYRGLVHYLSALSRAGMLEQVEARIMGDTKETT